MEWRNADKGFRVESTLEELEVKIEFFVATEKITDHGVGRMRTQIKKSLDSGHSVGERACLEARKTESAPIGSLKKNLFPKIVSFPGPDKVDQQFLEFAQDIFGGRKDGQNVIKFGSSELISN